MVNREELYALSKESLVWIIEQYDEIIMIDRSGERSEEEEDKSK